MDDAIFDNLMNRIIGLSINLERERVARQVNVAEVYNLMGHMASDHIIEAIKSYRTLTGQGLKESKDAIERVIRRDPLA